VPLTRLAGRCDVGMLSMPFGRRPSFAGPALLPDLRRHPGSGTQSDYRQAPETRSVDWRSLLEPSVGRFRLRNRSSCRAAPVVFRRNGAILVVVPYWSAIRSAVNPRAAAWRSTARGSRRQPPSQLASSSWSVRSSRASRSPTSARMGVNRHEAQALLKAHWTAPRRDRLR
jgi:hypothetical protein